MDINAVKSQNDDASVLNALSDQLKYIQTNNEMVLQKSADLLSQIIAYEARQDYVNAALAESETIAKEITTHASQRVSDIVVNAQKIVYPQQKQIKFIKMEISELNKQMDTLAAEKNEPKAEIMEIHPMKSEYSRREQVIDPSDIIRPVSEVLANDTSLQKSMMRCEYSLGGTQDFDIPGEDSEVKRAEQIDADLEQFNQFINYSIRLSNNKLQQDAMDWSQADESNSIMKFNADVEVRYFENSEGSSGQICDHDWQIKVEVEVPLENDNFVGFGKVSSAVMSTLMRYDKIVLNDVYPFNIIEPNPENIAMYFYNCLDDELSLLDIILKEITFAENNNMRMKFNKRNTDFDLLLQGGEFFFDGIRDKLCSLEEEQTSISVKLGQIFKSKR